MSRFRSLGEWAARGRVPSPLSPNSQATWGRRGPRPPPPACSGNRVPLFSPLMAVFFSRGHGPRPSAAGVPLALRLWPTLTGAAYRFLQAAVPLLFTRPPTSPPPTSGSAQHCVRLRGLRPYRLANCSISFPRLGVVLSPPCLSEPGVCSQHSRHHSAWSQTGLLGTAGLVRTPALGGTQPSHDRGGAPPRP